MPETTFFIAFTLVFGGLAAYLAWLDRRLRRLEAKSMQPHGRKP